MLGELFQGNFIVENHCSELQIRLVGKDPVGAKVEFHRLEHVLFIKELFQRLTWNKTLCLLIFGIKLCVFPVAVLLKAGSRFRKNYWSSDSSLQSFTSKD